MKNASLILLIFLFFSFCNQVENKQQSELPDQIDLTSSKYFPAIGNQGNIGACDWFAAVYYQMSYLFNKQLDREASPANIFSPKFGYNLLNNAWYYPANIRLDDVYNFVAKHGCASLQELPYDMADGKGYESWCTDSTIWKHALNYRTEGFSYFTLRDEAEAADYSFENEVDYISEIKKLLSQEEIVVIQTNTGDLGHSAYKKVMDDPTTKKDDALVGEYILIHGNNGPDHTMAVVGYNDNIWVDLNSDGKVQEVELGAIKIVDSFGENFQFRNKGCFWMAYSTIASSIWKTRVNRMQMKENYTPRILCKITLNTSERDKIRFQFGRSKTKNPTTFNYTRIFDPYGLGFNLCTAGVSLIEGGNFSFDGSSGSGDGSFVFDLTDIFENNSTDFWWLRLENTSTSPVLIKSFEILDVKQDIRVIDENLPVEVIQEECIRFISL